MSSIAPISSLSTLSELSIQLRKLQAEKNVMSAEIDRLERQARILADLKGVSIYELKQALQSACEAEAHGELRALVGTLQARVEGLQLGGGRKHDAGEKGEKMTYDAADNNIPSQDQFNTESAARARASLELRIGELEEIGTKQKEELDSLYKSTKVLTQKNSLLETQLLQQKALLDQWELRWKAKEEEDMEHIGNITAILTDYSEQSQIDTELEQRLIAAQAALAGEESQRFLVQSQLDSAQITYELKIDQFQHRIQFLEEQLQDVELQMTSLYTAFGMIQHDNSEERSEKEAWKRYLEESDAAFAKEEYERENKQQSQTHTANYIPSTVVSPEPDSISSLRSTGSGGIFSYPLSPPTMSKAGSSPPSYSPTRASVKPTTYPPIVKGRLLLLLDNIGQPIKPNDCITSNQSSPPKSMSFSARKLISSTKRSSFSSSTENRFKPQYCVLHGANGLYQIRYGDSYEGPVVGVHEFITAGFSSIEVSSLRLHFSYRDRLHYMLNLNFVHPQQNSILLVRLISHMDSK